MKEGQDAVSESFNRLLWHDSKLRGVHIHHWGDVDEVIADVQLRECSTVELIPVSIVLEDAIFFSCDLDLQGKRECSDDISSASCSAESEMKNRIRKERLKYSPGALKDYFHFHFYMIPPGGTLDVIAASFKLVHNYDASSFKNRDDL
jgi:hypothetical protein